MSTYTITAGEIGRLNRARALQTARARVRYYQAHRFMPKGEDPACRSDLANVAFVNGTPVETAVNVKRLAPWAATFDAGAVLTIDVKADVILLRHGRASSLKFFCLPELIPGRAHPAQAFRRDDLGAPIRLVAPEAGGAFVVQGDVNDAGEMKALRATLGVTREQIAQRKAFGAARQAERMALAALQRGAKKAWAAKRVFFGTKYGDALKLARACLVARRELRQALRGERPAWLAEAEFLELVQARNVSAEAARTYLPPKRRSMRWYQAGHQTPKEKALRLAREAAARKFRFYVEEGFAACCAQAGLSEETAGQFSRARNTVSEWPEEKRRLANAYRECMLARKELKL